MTSYDVARVGEASRRRRKVAVRRSLLASLDRLAHMPSVAETLRTIPPEARHLVERDLESAAAWLAEFRRAWGKRR